MSTPTAPTRQPSALQIIAVVSEDNMNIFGFLSVKNTIIGLLAAGIVLIALNIILVVALLVFVCRK